MLILYSKKNYNKGRKIMTDQLISRINYLAKKSKTEGSNGMVVTGPVAKSVNDGIYESS